MSYQHYLRFFQQEKLKLFSGHNRAIIDISKYYLYSSLFQKSDPWSNVVFKNTVITNFNRFYFLYDSMLFTLST